MERIQLFIPNEEGEGGARNFNLDNKTILTPENLEEPINSASYGWVIENIGDINNDGHDDLGVSAPFATIRDITGDNLFNDDEEICHLIMGLLILIIILFYLLP